MPLQTTDDCVVVPVDRDAVAKGEHEALSPFKAATCAKTDREAPTDVHPAAGSVVGGNALVEENQTSLPAKRDTALIASNGKGHIRDAVVLVRFLALCGNPTLDVAARAQCLTMIQFLWHCKYTPEEVCAVLAHTSKYFVDIYSTRGAHMGSMEASNIMVAQAYIAHSFVLDETCPLSGWHRFVCGGYCNLALLDAAIIRLMKLRKYRLRLDDREVQYRYGVLLLAATASP